MLHYPKFGRFPEFGDFEIRSIVPLDIHEFREIMTRHSVILFGAETYSISTLFNSAHVFGEDTYWVISSLQFIPAGWALIENAFIKIEADLLLVEFRCIGWYKKSKK